MSNPAYPSLPVAVTSTRTLRDGRQQDIGSDGAVRVRKLYADKFDFEVVHPALTAAEVATLEAFYATYGTVAAIDFTWGEDGQTYVVRFGANAITRRWASPGLRTVTVKLVGV